MTTDPAQNQPAVTEEHKELAARIIRPIFEDEARHIPSAALLIAAAEARAVEVATQELRTELDAIIKENISNRPDGNWMGKWGECRVCGGEIPHGHTEACDVYKQEKEIRSLTAKLALAERDSRRLDWLHDRAMTGKDDASLDDLLTRSGWPDLREAIDAAMQPEGGK